MQQCPIIAVKHPKIW